MPSLRPRPAGGGDPPGALPRPRTASRPRLRGGPAAAGRRGAAPSTSSPRRRVAAGAVAALGLGLLGLLLAGGPAGAAAQAPAQALPPAAGKAKKLAKCATATATSATCKVKKGGKYLVLKDPTVTVQPDGAEEEEPATPLSPNRFAKQFDKTYSPGAGPTANVTFAGEAAAAVALDGLDFKKSKAGTGRLKGKVDPGDREALAALDPASAPCVLEFRTPCGEDFGCTYSNTACAAGSTCPGGTAVSAECADRSAFDESPCACTALQELAALSPTLQGENPWKKLADKAYCLDASLFIECATVGGVQLPRAVGGSSLGLAGALQPSLGDLGPSLTYLALYGEAITSVPPEIGALTSLEILELVGNAITSVPTEIGALTGLEVLNLAINAITSVPTELAALTGLTELYLYDNRLTGVPTDFRTLNPSDGCYLFGNPGFSCANVGAGTTCCTGGAPPRNRCGEGRTGGPCYTG